MPFESSITQSILNYLNSMPGCTAEKVMGSSSSSGRADISGCYKGRALRIEVKTPDNRNIASKKQKINLRKWHNSGAIICVTYSLDFVKKVIEEVDKNTPCSETKKGCVQVYEEEKNHCVSYAAWKNCKEAI